MSRQSADFQEFLEETGVTQQQMDAVALTLPIPFSVGSDPKHRVLPSGIQGLGVFSCRSFDAGSRVCTLRVGEQWTVSGRYVNHDPAPNLLASMDGGNLVGLAVREIAEGDELTLCYRQVRSIVLAG